MDLKTSREGFFRRSLKGEVIPKDDFLEKLRNEKDVRAIVKVVLLQEKTNNSRLTFCKKRTRAND